MGWVVCVGSHSDLFINKRLFIMENTFCDVAECILCHKEHTLIDGKLHVHEICIYERNDEFYDGGNPCYPVPRTHEEQQLEKSQGKRPGSAMCGLATSIHFRLLPDGQGVRRLQSPGP